MRTASVARFNPRVLGLAVILASMFLSASYDSRPASAQSVCGNHTDILKILEESHSEKPRAIAISMDGKLLEVMVSSAGSWSILLTRPDRQTCVAATGEGWESLPAVAREPSA
jgi:hypothetical protein